MIALRLITLAAALVVCTEAHAQERPTAVVASANAAARQSPTPERFQSARQMYEYAPGAIYQVFANPSFVTAILLEPGETINAVAAGDTSRWQVSETEGEGRPIVLIKPRDAGLRTNIVVVTDRRTYVVEAEAVSGVAYSAQIAWTYPRAVQAPTPAPSFNFDYRIRTVRGARPAWMPTIAFDDGARTWIEFPESVTSTDLPPLFVIGPDGPELVNYRLDGRRFVVDRLFDVAELRLGVAAPVVVRIDHGARPSAQRRRRGSHP